MPVLFREGVGGMSYVHIAHGNMIDSLNHLHSEVVYNAVMNMVQNPNLTPFELNEILNIIEREVQNLIRFESKKLEEGDDNEA